MISIRKFWWAGLALATFVGCAEEQQTTPSTPPAATGPAPTTPPGPTAKPDMPEPSKPESKDADKKEMEKPESSPASLPKVEGPKIDAPKPDAPKPEADKKAESVKLNDEELAAIKKLPADEQALALKQLVCPVSDEHLGAMDMPIKVTAEGKTFFLCCKGCKKDLNADAKAVVAKLKN